MMSMDEWRKSPQSARNNPKLSSEQAQRIADEAVAGGQKWDVQEKINARRQADLNTECGIGLGSYGDIKVDDVIETFEMREKPRG